MTAAAAAGTGCPRLAANGDATTPPLKSRCGDLESVAERRRGEDELEDSAAGQGEAAASTCEPGAVRPPGRNRLRKASPLNGDLWQEAFGRPVSPGAVDLDGGSEGTFGIPQCTTHCIRLLRIDPCVSSGVLQRNNSFPDLQPPAAPVAGDFHCMTPPELALERGTVVASALPLTEPPPQPGLSLAGTGRAGAALPHLLELLSLGVCWRHPEQHIPSPQDSGWWHVPRQG